MKKELNPGVIALILIAVVAVVGWYGYQKMKPGDYVPSPGMGGASAGTPGAPPAAASSPAKSAGEQAYDRSMQGGGSVPGAPAGK